MDCGGPTAGDGWCPSCLVPADAAGPARRSVRPEVTVRTGRRAGRSAVTFGPVGRTLWTLAVLVVPVPFLWISDGLAGWGLGALWWGVITPWALRDLWRSGQGHRRL